MFDGRIALGAFTWSLFVGSASCSPSSDGPKGPAGGSAVSGSTSTGGLGSGGTSSGGMGFGGASSGGLGSGGLSSGGAATGGAATGGAATGGAAAGSSSGGVTSGGQSSGGANASGGSSPNGGTNSAGSAGAAGSAGSSGASGAAGSAGASSGGAGGGSGAGCKSLPVCDDFEGQGAPASPPWMVQLGYGNNGNAADVAIDMAQAHSPTRSMKFSGNTNPRFITTGAGVTSGPIYVRAFVRLGQTLGQGHITLIAVADAANKEARIGGQANYLHANLSEGDGLSPNPFVPCPLCLAPPANQWFCLEAMFDVGGTKISAWVDGQAIVTVDDPSDWHTASTWPGTITTLKFGYQSFGGDNATVHYDDIAVGSARIGCN